MLSPVTPFSARPIVAEPGLPRIFRPRSQVERGQPLAWLEEHLPEVRTAVRSSGAALLRGFDIIKPETFRALAIAFGGPLGENYEGPSPRTAVVRSVYTASEVPAALIIPEHAEMSYLPRMARHLYFWCQRPAHDGGATTLVDGRRILRELDPAKVQLLQTSNLRIRRRHAARRARLDPFELKPWTVMFGTEDRSEALERATKLGFQASFDARGALTLVSEQPFVRVHPETGEPAYLNHLLVFHASAPAALLTSAYQNERSLGAFLARPLAVGYRFAARQLGHDVAADVRLASGEPIADDIVDHVRDVVERTRVELAWQSFDLALVDNHIALHGRRPFRGPRKVAVAWSAEHA